MKPALLWEETRNHLPAAPRYFQGHKAQALYQPDGQPWVFGDNYLFIFDPSEGSGWRKHQLGEYRDIFASLPFDGLHIDQFGAPNAVDADVYLASPDGGEATLQRLDFTRQDGVVKLTVPRLDTWTMLVFDCQAGS